MLLPCNENGSNKLPPHATGKYESPHCLRKKELIVTKHLFHETHNTSHMDNIHKELQTKFGVCMQRKNYSISTYNLLNIIYENVMKLLLFHCCKVLHFLKNFYTFFADTICMSSVILCELLSQLLYFIKY